MEIECPCSFIEEGKIDDCTECPYVPVYGEDDKWEIKKSNIE